MKAQQWSVHVLLELGYHVTSGARELHVNDGSMQGIDAELDTLWDSPNTQGAVQWTWEQWKYVIWIGYMINTLKPLIEGAC